MGSIFYRLDELERVQQEILAAISGQESGDFSVEKARKYPKGDENARYATHSHDMHLKVTNTHTLVERVNNAWQQVWHEHMVKYDELDAAGIEAARAAIREVADWLGEEGTDEKWGRVAESPDYWKAVRRLRSQVEP